MQIELINGKIYQVEESIQNVQEYKIEKITEKCVLVRHRCDNSTGYFVRWYTKYYLKLKEVIEEINERQEKLERICK